jgi:hypothetical protein
VAVGITVGGVDTEPAGTQPSAPFVAQHTSYQTRAPVLVRSSALESTCRELPPTACPTTGKLPPGPARRSISAGVTTTTGVNAGRVGVRTSVGGGGFVGVFVFSSSSGVGVSWGGAVPSAGWVGTGSEGGVGCVPSARPAARSSAVLASL